MTQTLEPLVTVLGSVLEGATSLVGLKDLSGVPGSTPALSGVTDA